MIKTTKKIVLSAALALMVVQAAPVSTQFGNIITVEAAQKKGTVKSAVYMRASASSGSKILTTLSTNQEIVVLDTSSGWYKVQANGKTGYVWKSYIKVGSTITTSSTVTEKTGKVKSLWVGLRKKASSTSGLIKILIKGSKVSIVGESGDFYKVKSGDDTGYIMKKYIKVTESEETSTTASTENTSSTTESGTTTSTSTTKVTGQQVVDYAVQFVGNPYVWGGTSLTNGTDCSGFTMSVYKHFGYTIPRTSYSQRSAGTKVASISQAEPGDLICYSGHVALYMGNNKIVHASSAKTGIIIGNNASYRTIVAIRRIIND